jgi:hypothetical protein
MKILIAVQSCTRDAYNGANQAIRDTWATRLPDGWDLRFFLGCGAAKPIEQEHPNWQKDYRNLCAVKPQAVVQPPPFTDLKPGEILLQVPDDYPHMVHKQAASRQWALEMGYQRIFKCDTDTAIDFRKFKLSHADYCGVPDAGWDFRTTNHQTLSYAFGGNGYWLSERAAWLSLTEDYFTMAEDVWTGLALKNPHKILLTPTVSLGTTHLGQATASYRPEQMYNWWKKNQ